MDSSEPFGALESRITSALVATTRTTTQICAEDITFHRSLDPSLGAEVDKQNARLLALADRLLGSAAAGSTDAVGSNNTRSLLPDADALEGNWRGVVDVIDSLLERADITLDEFTGVVKRGAVATPKEQSPAPTTKRAKNLFRTQDNISKPQLRFEHLPRNREATPWKPILTSKPHAVVPFEDSIKPFTSEDGATQYQHPYQKEIERYEYPERMYQKADPIPYAPFETSTATLVDTPEALAAMLAELKAAKEIAIDLEHHDSRSYIGMVSLMQISTRNKDWIVDTLKPWRRRLECLNEVFADPSIVKVLHGAYMDMIWLQRDLGLYVVGLFDTHHAARALGYAGGSLAFLLLKFINFSAQKQYQMADWRIRPLPQELFEYARADTHFLLYVFDNMRNELIEKSNLSDPEQNLIRIVQDKSKEETLQRYENPVYDAAHGQGAGGWYRMLAKTPALLSKEQFSVFRAVHQWRDNVAREEDESPTYIMPQHVLFNIARTMPLDKAALFGVSQPMSSIFRIRADELVGIIAKAKADGPNGPDMIETMSKLAPEGYRSGFQPVANYLPKPTPTHTATGLITAPLKRPTVTDAPSAKSTASDFWGKLFGASEQKRGFVSESIRLNLALPQLTSQVFTDSSDAPAVQPLTVAPKQVEEPRENGQDEIFTIKQLAGKKRKAPEPVQSSSTGLDTNDDIVSVPDEEAQLAAEKAARKAERKAAKRLRKQQEALNGSADANGTPELKQEEEPLDYENAASILNAPREKPDRKKKPKHFDPYQKAMDAPKGLGRGQKERAGKSRTFKS